MALIHVKDVLEYLKKEGFKKIRTKGSHHRFADDKGNKVTVSYRSQKETLPMDTYKRILNQIQGVC